MRARSSFAWPVFLGNLGLGSGWPWLGSGGPPEGPDVDDDITNKLSQTIFLFSERGAPLIHRYRVFGGGSAHNSLRRNYNDQAPDVCGSG